MNKIIYTRYHTTELPRPKSKLLVKIGAFSLVWITQDEVSKAAVETQDFETKHDRFAAYKLFSRMFLEIRNHGLVHTQI